MTTSQETIINELVQSREVIDRFIADGAAMNSMQAAVSVMVTAIRNGNKILCCGNGGSMADAIHFAAELTGKYRDERAAMPAVALSDPAALTCIGNDFGFEEVFARQVRAIGRRGDVLLALSTSGTSANVLNAIDVALLQKSMEVIVITRRPSSVPLIYRGARQITIDTTQTDRCQEMTIKILHILVLLIEKELGLCKTS